MAYEEKYLRTLIESPENIVVMAFENGEVVGAAFGLPMRHETHNIKESFVNQAWDVDQIYFLGESIIRPSYRQKGLGKEFFHLRERRAHSLGQYNFLAFCELEDSSEQAHNGHTYKSPDAFLQNLGYQRTDLLCNIHWKRVDEEAESPKQLRFWLKEIDSR